MSAAPAHAVSLPLAQPAPTSCLTIRDAELGCVEACEPLEPVLRACARTGARAHLHPSGRIDVRYAIDAAGVARTDLALSGEDLAPVADCVRAAFARFRPCSPMGPGETFELPLRVSGDW